MLNFIDRCIEVAIRGCPDVNECPPGIDVNIAAASYCKKKYLENMETFVKNNWQIFRRVMETKHKEFKDYSICRYDNLIYLRGDESQYQSFRQQLIESIEIYFISFKKARTKKEILIIIGTITAAVVIAIVAGAFAAPWIRTILVGCAPVEPVVAGAGAPAAAIAEAPAAAIAGAPIAAVAGAPAAAVAGAPAAAIAGAPTAAVAGAPAAALTVLGVSGATGAGAVVGLYHKYIELNSLSSENNQLHDTLPREPSSLTRSTVIQDPLINIQNIAQSSVNVNIINNNNFYPSR
jgi:hypothetical protein